MAGAGERFRRADRLRSSKDFRRVAREGVRVMTRSLVVLVANRRSGAEGPARLGLTVSRRVGPAVARARVKRRVRECFRRHRDLFPWGKDVVVIARPGAEEATLAELGRQLEDSLKRAAGGRRS